MYKNKVQHSTLVCGTCNLINYIVRWVISTSVHVSLSITTLSNRSVLHFKYYFWSKLMFVSGSAKIL